MALFGFEFEAQTLPFDFVGVGFGWFIDGAVDVSGEDIFEARDVIFVGVGVGADGAARDLEQAVGDHVDESAAVADKDDGAAVISQGVGQGFRGFEV